MTPEFSPREQVVEVVNRLFFFTDSRAWEALQQQVFADEVVLDMTSLGAEAATTVSAQQICDLWEEGFRGLDAVHHHGSNYLIDIHDDRADVVAYAIATHFKAAATQGKVRTFVGSYDLQLARLERGWRITSFRYNLKYMDGNVELK
ncbi:MAG: nuclear transport factor 2 family protein [Bacteroidota bacterium]